MHDVKLFKVAVVGDSFVGKTSIVQTYLSGGTQFSKNYIMTSDVNVNVKDTLIPDSKDVVELLLYDSAGNSLYEEFLPKFWKGISALFVVFDVTSEESFNSTRKWVDIVKSVQERPTVEDSTVYSVPGILFANKIDLQGKRIVTSEGANSVATHLGYEYFEGSAKNNVSVEEAFSYITKELHTKSEEINE